MPPVAFAYGSFGDIVATAELIAKIVTLLRRSGKPSSEWTETETELKSLDSELKYLILKQTSTLDTVIATRIQEEGARCRHIMSQFHSKITVPQSLWRTVLWAHSEEKALAEFRRQVIERRTALSLVVGLINSGALSAVSGNVIEGHGRIQVVQEGVSGLTGQLAYQRDRIAEVGAQVSQGNDGIRLVQEYVEEVGREVGRGTDKIQEGVSVLTKQLSSQKETLTEAQILKSALNPCLILEAESVSAGKKKLNKWLEFPPSMAEKQHETQKLHHEGTGSWFLNGREFTRWNDKSGVLWVMGKSGTGKSVLSSTVIRKLFDDKPRSGTAISYFYFDFRDNKKQLVEIMLRTIILQLSAQSLHPYAALHEQYQLSSGRTLPTYQHLLEVLDKLLLEFKQTYIVLDTLDECTEDNILMQFISRLRQWTTSSLHLLVTSHPREFYMDAIGDMPQVSLERESTEHDIGLFISQELRSQRYLEHVARRTEEIVPKVVKKSNGMFRLAACLLHELSRHKLNPDLDMIMANLPGDLFGIYSRFLKPISQMDFICVARVLRWLVFSGRPLSLLELDDALAFNFSDPVQYVYEPTERRSYAAEVILDGVQFLLEDGADVDEDHGSALQGASERGHVEIVRLLLENYANVNAGEGIFEGSLEAASRKGHVDVVRLLLENIAQVNQYMADVTVEDMNATASSDAVPFDSMKMRGSQQSRLDRALRAASSAGNADIVHFLLQNGADINAAGVNGTALRVASEAGQTGVVRLLLDAGATDYWRSDLTAYFRRGGRRRWGEEKMD